MTEAEALTKWCPFTRVGSDWCSFNRTLDPGLPSNSRCIGSACMAWRWDQAADGKWIGGHCGLVGRP